MTDLIAILTTENGTWEQVESLMKAEEWDKTYIITTPFYLGNLTSDKPINMIIIDDKQSLTEMRDGIKKQLDGKLKMDIAVNILSGTGKEHMALLSALIQLGVGMRLVIEKDGLIEL